MVILPLPPALLDILFTFNIVLAVMVLLVAVSAKRPLELCSCWRWCRECRISRS
ncbi:FHIPEP family type III secretion protein [Escherichia coli]